MELKDKVKAYSYPLLALASTTSLISIAFSLIPIAQWNSIQIDCVSRVTAEGYEFVDKVWACSGGGK